MIAMPFSGGQDSYINLVRQIRTSADPVHLFYFRMGTPVSDVEEERVIKLHEEMKDLYSFNDMRLHFINAFDLRGLSRDPNPFLPFRNYFFGQYLLGLGFSKVLFSFSSEDSLFHDTSLSFMSELERMAKDNMGITAQVFTHTANMCRLDYARFMLDTYKLDSVQMRQYQGVTYSCSSPKPCRACMCCLLREIGDMWLWMQRRSLLKTPYNAFADETYRKAFVKNWANMSTLRDLYRRVISNQFRDSSTRDQYWNFLESFEKGALLKGVAL